MGSKPQEQQIQRNYPQPKKISRLRECGRLYWSFLKTGLFTLGGGYAMLPMLRAETVHKYAWVTDEEMLNIYSISQTLPGTIAVNTATYIGYRRRGFAGAAAAALGMVTPSLLIITLIAAFLGSFTDTPWVAKAFTGIRAGVAGILIVMLIDLCKKIATNVFSVILALAALILVVFKLVSVLWLIPLGGLAGVLYYTYLHKLEPDSKPANESASQSLLQPEDDAKNSDSATAHDGGRS